MKRDLLGRKLVVTGAARGIGEKVARLAAARGARVTVIGLEADRLRALAVELGPAASWRDRMTPVLARDLTARVRGKAPAMVPIAAAPGSPALMNAPDALPGYQALQPPGTTFRNEVAARVIPTIAAYRPGRAAKKVTLPILFCVSDTDSVTPPAQTLRYAATAPRGEIKRYAAGHFDFYNGETFEALVRDQTEFLVRQLRPAPAVSTS